MKQMQKQRLIPVLYFIKDKKMRSKIINKKAQVKMGETIAILFIFFVLLMVGAMVYFNVQKTTFRREMTEQFEARSVELAQVISFLPELQCTEKNVVEPGCFDLYKLAALDYISKQEQNSAYYAREFESSLISVNLIYPDDVSYVIFNNTPVKYFESSSFQVPVSVFDAFNDASSFGVLEVRVFR